jgi:hypothetical protein
MDITSDIKAISLGIHPLEKFILAFANALPAPLIYDSGRSHYGFRFGKPDVRHFCLLKGVRSVSGLNASLELVRTGYSQEIMVILRTVVECASHIEFVLNGYQPSAEPTKAASLYLESYFSDFARNEVADFKTP